MSIQLDTVLIQFEESSITLGKALAVAQAGMNTQIGVTQALTLPPPASGIAIAFAIATGLGAIKNILGEPIPRVSIDTSSPFGDGGVIGGKLHSSGGTWINAEKGEGVINRRSMAIGWVRKQASYLNTIGGGVPFMANGGIVPDQLGTSKFLNLERALSQSKAVLVTNDLHQVQQRDEQIEISTTL